MKGKPAVMTHRVITMLDRTEMEFLDKMGNDSMFSTGHKLSHNQILKGLVYLAMECGLSGEKVSSTEALKEKMLRKAQERLEEKLRKMDMGQVLKK